MADVAYIPGEPGRERRPLVGYAMVIAAALLFAVNGTVSKVVLSSGISSLELTQVRATGAFVGFALALALVRPGSLRVRLRELPYLAVFGVAGVAFVQWLYFVSIDRLPIGIALLLEYLAPILIALWALDRDARARPPPDLARPRARPRRARVRRRGVARDLAGRARRRGGALGCGRLRRVRADGRARGRASAIRPRCICYGFLFAALFWAIVQPLWRFPGSRIDDDVSLLGHLSELSLPVWSLMLFVVVVGTMVTFLLVTASLRHISATSVGIVAMLEPVAASAVAFLWLGQSFGATQLVGGAIVLVAILLAQTAR